MNQYRNQPERTEDLSQHPLFAANKFFARDRTASVWLNIEIENEPQPFTGKITYHDPFHLILDNEIMLDRKLIVLIRMESEK